MKNLFKKIMRYGFSKSKSFLIHIAYFLNHLSVWLQIKSRRLVQLVNHDTSNYNANWFVLGRAKLNSKIAAISKAQKKNYEHYSYFYDYPYQSLVTAGIFGERSTEERFDIYKLKDFLSKEDMVLDLGCNCGFMGVYAAYRTGCKVDGIDINPYAIEIGVAATEFLRLQDDVNLTACRVQDFVPEKKYTAVFSFATHWTDDKNYRVQLDDHFALLEGLLDKDGIMFFESHCADVGQESFYQSVSKLKERFDVLYQADTDSGSRHYYVFRKK